MQIEFKRYRTFRGMEGQGFNLDLCIDGRKAAEVDDEARGAAFRWRWLDEGAKAKWDAYVASLPEVPWRFAPGMHKRGDDVILDELLSEHLLRRKLMNKVARGVTVFILKGEDPVKHGWRSVNLPFKTGKEWALEKFGSRVKEFANEKALSEVLVVELDVEPREANGPMCAPATPAPLEAVAVRALPAARGVGAFCKDLIRQGKSTEEVLTAVREKFPGANTTAKGVASYRCAVKKEG